MFARADAPGTGGSLVIDLEALRELSQIKENPASQGVIAEIAGYMLVAGAVQLKDNASVGPLVAKAAALFAIFRQWDVWPRVHRVGLIAPAPAPGVGIDAMADATLLVFAVQGSQAEATEMLKGFAALDRAMGKAHLTFADGSLCFESPDAPVTVCAKGGPGYIAFSTAAGLRGLAAPSGAPAVATTSAAILRLRAEVPMLGKGEFLIEGKGAVRLSATLKPTDASMASTLAVMANAGLAKLDQFDVEMRALMAPVLSQTQQTLAADAEAPAGLKKAAAGMSLDKMLDPDGLTKAFRDSIKIKQTDGTLTAEATVPEARVRQLTSFGALSAIGVVGALSAIAVPNFIKYQCRAKQAEAKANLGGVRVAYRAFLREKNRVAASFDELQFQPEAASTRYTYCMNGQCLGCTRPGCHQLIGDENPCQAMTAVVPGAAPGSGVVVCAVGDVDDDSSDVDVWTMDGSGEIANVKSDCD